MSACPGIWSGRPRPTPSARFAHERLLARLDSDEPIVTDDVERSQRGIAGSLAICPAQQTGEELVNLRTRCKVRVHTPYERVEYPGVGSRQ
jgi:hypothetical protein